MKTSSYSAFRSISVLNESNTIFYFLSILVYVLFPFTLGQQEDTMRSNSFFHLLQYVLCITAILPDVFFKEAFTSYKLLHAQWFQAVLDSAGQILFYFCLHLSFEHWINYWLTTMTDQIYWSHAACRIGWEGCQQSQHKLGTNAGLLDHSHIR